MFIWRSYLDLKDHHEVNQEDVVVWTAKILIIKFTIMEMHHSDRVKLQFGMHQGIPCPPR